MHFSRAQLSLQLSSIIVSPGLKLPMIPAGFLALHLIAFLFLSVSFVE